MATVQLKVQPRTAGGKGAARQLRMSGHIPGIVYGAGEENLPISLDSASFELMLRRISSGNAILDLEVQGRESSELKVIIKEVQRNPVDNKVIHVDLEHISMTRKVRVQVPIHLEGTAVGVKEGGILEHLLRQIEVDCLPMEIPERVTLDVSELGRNMSIHVRDLNLPAQVHVHDSPERVVATVVAKAKEEVVAAPEEEAAPAEGEAAPAEGAPKAE